jgi:proton glutamate symport protein
LHGLTTVRFSFPSFDVRRHPVPATITSLIALVAGIGLGSLAHRWQSPTLLAAVPILQPIGDLWLNALLMIAMPLVVSHLMVSIIGAGRSRQASKMSGNTLLWFFLMLVLAGLFTVAAGDALVKWFPVDPATRAAMKASVSTDAKPAASRGPAGSMKDWVANLIPSNLVRAAGDGEMLPVILAAMLFAMAIRGIAEEHRVLLHTLLKALAAASMTLAGYILRVLPPAVFALTYTASAKSGPVIAGGLAYYVVAVSGFLVAVTLLLYPVTWWLGRIPLSRFAKGMLPSQAVAFTTRSSLASLPSLLDAARTRIGVPEPVAAFVLPVAVSVFKLNRTISSPLKLIVLAHLYGTSADSTLKLFFVLVATLLSFGSPGLPSGGSLVTLPLYLAAGLPLQGVVLLNAVDSIPDLFKTVLNVTSDMSVAVIVARFTGFRFKHAGGMPDATSMEPELAVAGSTEAATAS